MYIARFIQERTAALMRDILADGILLYALRSTDDYGHDTVAYVCPSVCLTVTNCIVAKRRILQQVSEQVNRKCPLETRFYNFQPPTPNLSP